MAYAKTVCHIESGVSFCTSDDYQSGNQSTSNVGAGPMPKMESSVIICNNNESKNKLCSKNWFIKKQDGKIHKTYKGGSIAN